MHLVEVIGATPLGLRPGEYVAEDVTAGEMLAYGGCKVLPPPPVEPPAFDATLNWNGKRILFVRPGGFGDLLFLTPTIAEIRRRWPQAEVAVACFARYRDALLNNPDVKSWVSYPVESKDWSFFDAQVWLEGLIEANREAEKTHAVDLVAARCGLEITDKRMKYYVTPEEAAAAEKEFPRWPDRPKRIGIQVSASGRCRIYPHIIDVAKRLWRDGHEVFLFGSPGEFQSDMPEGIVNLMMLKKTFRESCAILGACDVLVGPDSALVHVAGALGVPCVALYGPFPWQLRTAYAPETFALQGVGRCSPCFHHARPGRHEFPENGPCAATGRCEVLAAIPAERVMREVWKKLERVTE
jgi:ADP-heptose:LPS heptosyltransferase